MKHIKLILKILIPLICVCLIAFVVLHLSPELSIRAEMLRLYPSDMLKINTSEGIPLFSNKWYFHESPKMVNNLSEDKYAGKGTLYEVGMTGCFGYSYYLVNKCGFLYFASNIGSA